MSGVLPQAWQQLPATGVMQFEVEQLIAPWKLGWKQAPYTGSAITIHQKPVVLQLESKAN